MRKIHSKSSTPKDMEFTLLDKKMTKLSIKPSIATGDMLFEVNELQFGSLDFAAAANECLSIGNQTISIKSCSSDAVSSSDRNEMPLISLDNSSENSKIRNPNLERADVCGSLKQVSEEQMAVMKKVVADDFLILSDMQVSNGRLIHSQRMDGERIMFSTSCSMSETAISSEELPVNGLISNGHCALQEDTDHMAVVPPTMGDPGTTSTNHIHGEVLHPRGLINPGNLCFLNSTLQALLGCSPFVELLHRIKVRNMPKNGYPTARAFVEFISTINMTSSNLGGRGVPVETLSPLSPSMFDPVLEKFTPDIPSISMSGRPRQEDAQEFLSFIMDQLHNELLKLEGQTPSCSGAGSSLISSADDDWEIVGPKNKTTVTRTQTFIPSALSDIFGGQMRSVVKARGNKASATIQPYLLLHLDILPDAVHTIEDALHLYSAPESLQGYKASAGKAGVVSASKSVKLQTLSKVMVLHLMRFGYSSKGSTKLLKPVYFPLELILGRELLASPTMEGRRYELVATVTHHGREPSKGHYTADAKSSDGQWLRYDDASVTVIGGKNVLHEQAYILFYKQMKRLSP